MFFLSKTKNIYFKYSRINVLSRAIADYSNTSDIKDLQPLTHSVREGSFSLPPHNSIANLYLEAFDKGEVNNICPECMPSNKANKVSDFAGLNSRTCFCFRDVALCVK